MNVDEAVKITQKAVLEAELALSKAERLLNDLRPLLWLLEPNVQARINGLMGRIDDARSLASALSKDQSCWGNYNIGSAKDN